MHGEHPVGARGPPAKNWSVVARTLSECICILKTGLERVPDSGGRACVNDRTNRGNRRKQQVTIKELLRPHTSALIFGMIAVVGEGVANLLEPWPLKIVLDGVLRDRQVHGWLAHLITLTVGTEKMAVLKFACLAVLAIAFLDAVSSYAEKYLTNSIGQWVAHDLRRTLYLHI